jgi:hypothetical protein
MIAEAFRPVCRGQVQDGADGGCGRSVAGGRGAPPIGLRAVDQITDLEVVDDEVAVGVAIELGAAAGPDPSVRLLR